MFLRFKDEESGHPEQVALFIENLDGTGLRQLTPYGAYGPDARWPGSSLTGHAV